MRNKVFDNTSSRAFFNKNCPLSGKDAPLVDYKNINLLRRYMTEKGKILPSRVTQVSTKKHRKFLKISWTCMEFREEPISEHLGVPKLAPGQI